MFIFRRLFPHLFKNKNAPEALGLWWNFIKRDWPFYVFGMLMVILADAMQVLSMRTLGWVIDFFDSNQSVFFLDSSASKSENFLTLFFILVMSRILLTLGRFGWRITLARQSHKAAAYLRGRLWDHVRFFPRQDLQQYFTKGHLMNASTSDVGSSRFIFGFTLVALVDVLFLGLIALGTLFTIHVPMTLISLCGLIGIPFFVRKLSELEIRRYGMAQEFLSKFNDLSSQVVSTIRLQRLTQTGEYWKRYLLRSAEKYRARRLLSAFTSLRYIPLMGGATVLTYALLFSVGGHFVLSGSMSVGDFVAIQGLVFLLQDPLMELGFIISEFQKGMTSLQRLNTIYSHTNEQFLTQQEGESVHASQLVDLPVLETKKLSFSHRDSDKYLFQGINISLSTGDRLGVTGSIGSGKSTLLSILGGLERRGIEGELRFLGRPYSQFKHSDLRSFIGHVHQIPFLFATSIRQNICMDLDLSDDQVWHYLEVAGLASDVVNFPHQLNTPLGEWGINFSGGQKQRLTLARALARQPKLLLLDDCLSAVDTVTEEKILKNLDEKLSQTTLIWVAHRTSTLKYCTKFLNLDEVAKNQSQQPHSLSVNL